MPEKRIHVYSTATGRKLAHTVPESWLRIFRTLSATPSQVAADQTAAAADTQTGEPVKDSEPVTRSRRRRGDSTPPEDPPGSDTTSDATPPTEE